MQANDYDAVVALWQATPGVGDAEPRDEFCSYLERNPGLSLVARDAGQVVAAVCCGHDGRRGYLYHLAVAATHRRQGIARRLVETCLAQLKSLRIRKCSLYLFQDNQAGEAFWRELGWIERTELRLLAMPIEIDSPADSVAETLRPPQEEQP